MKKMMLVLSAFASLSAFATEPMKSETVNTETTTEPSTTVTKKSTKSTKKTKASKVKDAAHPDSPGSIEGTSGNPSGSATQ